MDSCIFCRIIAHTAPAYIIAEDALTITFLSLENHPLVVPKAHIADIFALDEDTAGAIMGAAVPVARALRDGLGCDGVLLAQANGAAAGQEVFHFHLHLYPRWRGDGGRVTMPPVAADDAAKATRLARLRAALGAGGQDGGG